MLNDTGSVGHVAQDVRNVWRVRVAVVLDLMTSVATMVMAALVLVGIARLAVPFGHRWSMLLPMCVLCAGSALLLGVIVYLAPRGQTIGLAVTGLRWTSRGARSSGWRVLGEPQFWCASVPAIYIFLNSAADIWNLRDFPVLHPLPIGYLFPLEVSCAVLLMVTFRRQPGRLISGFTHTES